MTLAEYRQDMETCCRCSACKFIPFERVKGFDYVNACPSIARYNFHAYSGSGRLGTGVALLEKEIAYSEKLLEVVYNCQMCGACDVSCKYAMDMEVLEPLQALRIECVKSGHTLPVFDKIAANLKKGATPVSGAEPGGKHWYDGLQVTDYTRQKSGVVFHAGCRASADSSRWNVARSAVSLMQKAGIDVGIAGGNELCCGGRVYQVGYEEEFLNQARTNIDRLRQAGVKTLVTACAECYQAFKVLYEKFNLRGDIEVLHATELFARLIESGKIKPRHDIPLRVTYHDPCHLGRLGEPFIHWQGKRVPGQIIVYEPSKEFRRGTRGVYAEPRTVLKSIPGIDLVEMPRNREYAWCCGAGGGVLENNPQFAEWTANERLREAVSTGAAAIVTACPGCESIFAGSAKRASSSLKIYDVVELLAQAAL